MNRPWMPGFSQVTWLLRLGPGQGERRRPDSSTGHFAKCVPGPPLTEACDNLAPDHSPDDAHSKGLSGAPCRHLPRDSQQWCLQQEYPLSRPSPLFHNRGAGSPKWGGVHGRSLQSGAYVQSGCLVSSVKLSPPRPLPEG